MATKEQRKAMVGVLPIPGDGMTLECHDAEVDDSLNFKRKFLDYDYQAEQHVQDALRDFPDIVKFVLLDFEGERAKWERADGKITLTWKSERFNGEWGLGVQYG